MSWTSEDSWREFFRIVMNDGEDCSPRGAKIREIENARLVMPSNLLMAFDSRKLNLDYIRREFQWYLRGDNRDLTICEHAKIWRDHVNGDGSLSSNYGYYLFTLGGLVKAVFELTKDPDSRRAAVSIFSSHEHLRAGIKDVPCTYAISFRIRRGKLNMSVHMRSNDLWFGLGNDAPIFGFIHQMAWRMLQVTYPELELGQYVHIADSLHVYEPHFEKAYDIALCRTAYTAIELPQIHDVAEVDLLLSGATASANPDHRFINWLYEVSL